MSLLVLICISFVFILNLVFSVLISIFMCSCDWMNGWMNERKKIREWKGVIQVKVWCKQWELNLSSALTKIIFVFALFAIGTPPHNHFEIVFMSPSSVLLFYLFTFFCLILIFSLRLSSTFRLLFYLNDVCLCMYGCKCECALLLNFFFVLHSYAFLFVCDEKY